jgi:hypothetical protein
LNVCKCMHDAQEGDKRRMYLEVNMDLVPCTRSSLLKPIRV